MPFAKGNTASVGGPGKTRGSPDIAPILRTKYGEKVMRTLVKLAKDPDPRIRLDAAKYLMDRMHGRPVQATTSELTGTQGGPVKFTWEGVPPAPAPVPAEASPVAAPAPTSVTVNWGAPT